MENSPTMHSTTLHARASDNPSHCRWQFSHIVVRSGLMCVDGRALATTWSTRLSSRQSSGINNIPQIFRQPSSLGIVQPHFNTSVHTPVDQCNGWQFPQSGSLVACRGPISHPGLVNLMMITRVLIHPIGHGQAHYTTTVSSLSTPM